MLLFNHRLYRKLQNNVLEISVYLNLIVISTATLSEANSPVLVYSLVGLMFATMIGVFIYHFHLLYIVKSQLWLKFRARVRKLLEKTEPAGPGVDVGKSSHDPHKIVTFSEIELREPLL